MFWDPPLPTLNWGVTTDFSLSADPPTLQVDNEACEPDGAKASGLVAGMEDCAPDGADRLLEQTGVSFIKGGKRGGEVTGCTGDFNLPIFSVRECSAVTEGGKAL